MFCHQCGKDLIETACFCPNCGAKRLARTAMPAPQINSECVATSHPNTTSTQSQEDVSLDGNVLKIPLK